MDHSVEGYLGRQSTQVLEKLLQDYCSSEERLYDNQNTVGLILKELKRRYIEPKGEQSEFVRAAWERYLKHLEEGTQEI